jgi:hypothetical protein
VIFMRRTCISVNKEQGINIKNLFLSKVFNVDKLRIICNTGKLYYAEQLGTGICYKRGS